MLQMLALAPAERRLLPGGNLRGPMPYVIAIMTFAMMVIAAAGLALSNAADLVAGAVENRFVIQLPDGRGGQMEAAAQAARRAPGVSAVRPVPEAEIRETLEQWLGPAGLGAELPVPALIHLEIAPGASTAPIVEAVRRAAPQARLIAEEATLGPLLRSIRALQWLALALVLLMAAATSAAVVLATRGALDTHRSTIEIMHGIGATDEQIARLFQDKIARSAMFGSLAGGALAAVAIAILAAAGGSALAGDLAGRAPLGLADLLILAAIPVAAVAISTAVARLAVLGALRQAP